MASNFPTSLDNFSTSHVYGEVIQASTDNDLADALNKIEARVIKEAPLNVQWPEYGATGDSTTDDTAAIAAALAAANGGEVCFPVGNYKSDPIIIDVDGIKIRGGGKGATRIFNRSTAGQNFVMVRADDVVIEGVEIDGMRSAQGANTGSALTVGGVTAGEKANRFILRDSIVRPSGFGGLVVWDVNGFTVEGCDVYSTYDDALMLLEGSRYGRVVGNSIYVNSGANGISLDTNTSVPPHDISLAANNIYLNGTVSYAGYQWGVMLLECLDISVVGNTIDCSAGTPNGGIRCVSATANPKRFSIIGNTIRGGSGCTDGGISIDATTSTAAGGNRDLRATIIGNPVNGFTGTSAAGVRVLGASRVGIRANPIVNCYYGIHAEVPTGATVSGLAIVGNDVAGTTNDIWMVGAGTGSAQVVGNVGALGVGTAWTVDQSGLAAIASARAANSSVFVDSADNKLKFKDSGGAVNLLY